jgi:transcriptional regulator with XRE-family HTH domain
MKGERIVDIIFDPMMLGRRAQRIRVKKKISIESLAQKAQVNKNTIVRFEKGMHTRMETIYKICNVLKVSPLKLIEGKLVKGKDYDIKKHRIVETKTATSKKIPRQERVESSETYGMKIGDLNYRLPGGRLTAKVLELSSRGKLKTHAGEEFLFCLTGTIGVEISNIKAVLKKGDAIFFWGTEPHLYYNADEEKKVSVALSVVNSTD